MKLCWKCRERFKGSGNPYIDTIVDTLHCHHEPKEKEKCWCEYDYKNPFYVECSDADQPDVKSYRIKFCPVCGRKL